MDLLRRARAAVRAGDPRGALAHLEQHARRFPASPLAPEAAAVRIEATCAVGDRQTARMLADQFARQWPDSPLSRRVSRLCGEDP
jgi:outer membrane protein assembly factor BamD (BamD/ComL family)